MNQLPPIAQLGNPILRKIAPPLSFPLDDKTLELIDTLIATAIAHQGVGIAAPQVSQSCRLLIVASHPSDRYPHAPIMPPTAMLNPQLISHSEEIITDWEGCLSVPNIRGLVPRYRRIEVEYITPAGELKETILWDFVARIFQHELDHLNGIIFTDRVQQETDLYTEAAYRQIINQQPT